MSNFDEILNQGKKNEPKDNEKSGDWKEEQRKRREQLFEMIEAVCPDIVSSAQQMRAFLTVQSHFEKYSLNNNILIYAQRADATRLKDFKSWKEDGGSIKKGGKSLMILEPAPYTKDGEERIAFNPKTMFDILDVTGVQEPQQGSCDKAMLIRALVNDSPVDIKTVQSYPADKPEGAYFDVEDNCIYAKAGMAVEDIFTAVSQAMACAEMAGNEPFRAEDHAFQARCAAFTLAKKYGVPEGKVDIHSVPPRYADFDNSQIKKELGQIHDAVKAISTRMNKALLERPREQNRSKSDREAR